MRNITASEKKSIITQEELLLFPDLMPFILLRTTNKFDISITESQNIKEEVKRLLVSWYDTTIGDNNNSNHIVSFYFTLQM